ncbi:ATP synthase gamma chain [Ectocarpus siliculosus]|uniref:ATP synthase gamma chain, chloroplastic n=1 Tax=Ectocarpus siliculosus TaxID=2880 RepID=D8LBF0_ECTSI|nr:ATP synthase gamma chain [Ectocarpus siliculosus]|eukprot:CBN76659.1 ATP synthase gamma chain [Ectocarpus siliculosus]
MVQLARTLAALVGSAACASAFMGPAVTSFSGVRVVDNVDAVVASPARRSVVTPRMGGKENAIRQRIVTVNNTKKITTAMRLVAAAKVRRAQDAVLRTRPFSETLQSIFGALIAQLGKENLDLPLLNAREVKNVLLVGLSGDRGLCGAYNSYAIKKTEARGNELTAQGYNVEYVTIGKKISQYFKRRSDTYTVKRAFDCGQAPNAAEASAIAQELLSDYLSGEFDSVEIVYTKFVSLIASEPSIRTLLPLSIRGIEDETDEIFQLTTQGGKFTVDREEAEPVENAEIPQDLIFEQDPIQILNSILPLYLDGQILRMLQESVAAELAARMASMGAASDNAADLAKRLSLQYNRARQASVTQELLEIVAGADAAQSGAK